MDGMDGRHGHERGGWCSSPSGFWVLLGSSGVLLVKVKNPEEHQGGASPVYRDSNPAKPHGR